MTLVNHQTGELVETLDKVSARRLTDRIRLLAETVAEQVEKMAGLIDEARVGSAWLALGYPSWTAYVSAEFGGVLPRLDREPRQEFVRELAARGMSTRAIAPVVGTSQKTVVKDAQVIPEVSPAASVTQVAPKPWPETVASRPPITGLDGKVYTPPEPKPKPVVLAGGAAEFDNAQQASKSLARALSQLLSFEHSNMREGMRRYWRMASLEVSPTQRADVTAEQMRAAARGLLLLADEWEEA